jgi:hypothetical protein
MKQETFEKAAKNNIIEDWLEEHGDPKIDKKVEKQLELEEAAANLADPNICKTDNWIAGANWQAERMYSYDELRAIAYKYYCMGQLDSPTEGMFNLLIHQDKKK